MSGQLHHVSLTVKNIDTSMRFYEQFGYQASTTYQDETVEIRMLKNQGSRIELFHFKVDVQDSSKEPLIHLKEIGIRHFALCSDNLDSLYTQLNSTTTTTEIRHARLGGFRYFFCLDPDNNQVEIIEEV